MGNSVLFYEVSNRHGAPRWRGPAMILDIDDAIATEKSQGQTLKVAWYCVR